MAVLNYASQYLPRMIELYNSNSKSFDLYKSNPGIKIVNTKDIRIPTLTTGGYKDHDRSSIGFNTGSISNNWETKTLDHDRDVEFPVDPTAEIVCP